MLLATLASVAVPEIGEQQASVVAPAIVATATEPSVSSPPPLTFAARPPAEKHASLDISAEAFDYDRLPGRLAANGLRERWRQGLDLERREALLESARIYEEIALEVPEESYTYWRISRNYWRFAENLPLDAKDQRVFYFELGEDWAGRGLGVDSDCAPCMLWKFVSMGRQATTKGLITAVRDVREMDRLVRRGIELQPDHSDDEGNAVLGNLYYSGAVFYRVIPDWFWLKWFLGMRGDKERALVYARRAVEISAVRVDYRVELGATLLCVGTEKNRPEAIAEGIEVLEQAESLGLYLSTDHLDRAHAEVLMASPEKACGYSRDGFIDVNGVLKEAKQTH